MSAYLLALSAALGESGNKVDLFTRAYSGDAVTVHELAPNIRLISLDDGLGLLLKNDIYTHHDRITAALISFLEDEKEPYDLIFSNYWLSAVIGRLAAAKLKLPHVVMFHTLGRAKIESCPCEIEPEERLREEESLASSCDLVITASKSEKLRALEYFNIPPQRAALVPCGIDRSLFRPLDQRSARNALGLSNKKIILYVGRIEPVKGFDLLMEAAALLPAEDNFQIIVVGGGEVHSPEIAHLKESIANLNLAGPVRFTGSLDHSILPLYFNAADLTVIPSAYESLSMVALESLACGTPLVAGPAGVIPELLAKDSPIRAGVLLDNREPALWAAAIRKVYTMDCRLDQKAIDSLLAPYSWTAAANSLVEHFSLL